MAVLVGLGIGHGVWVHTSNNPLSSSNGGSSNPSGGNGGSSNPSGGSSGPSNSGTIASAVDPALVDINTTLSYQDDGAAGTGIVLTSDGYVLTNNHVIEGATTMSATDIGNGHTYSAVVVGYDRSQDVAIIKLQGATGLTTAKFGDSSKVSVGDEVVGLGNAGGVGGTPSTAGGEVVALNQSITAEDESNGLSENLKGLIETNADIQPGDSGGALVNSSGDVIGMDTAASSGFYFQTQGGQGFAIPIDEAISLGSQIRSGTIASDIHLGQTAFLGVYVSTTTTNQSSGVTLSEPPVAGGPAATAGLTQGDVITSIDGQTVNSPDTLTNLLLAYHPGDRVQVGFVDANGQSHSATIQLGNGPPQ